MSRPTVHLFPSVSEMLTVGRLDLAIILDGAGNLSLRVPHRPTQPQRDLILGARSALDLETYPTKEPSND